MRRCQPPEFDPAGGEDQLASSMDWWVTLRGAEAAAWLVLSNKRQFHLNGSVRFSIPTNKTTPPWFRVAVETLNRRPKWTVQTIDRDGVRNYNVVWIDWRRYARA